MSPNLNNTLIKRHKTRWKIQHNDGTPRAILVNGIYSASQCALLFFRHPREMGWQLKLRRLATSKEHFQPMFFRDSINLGECNQCFPNGTSPKCLNGSGKFLFPATMIWEVLKNRFWTIFHVHIVPLSFETRSGNRAQSIYQLPPMIFCQILWSLHPMISCYTHPPISCHISRASTCCPVRWSPRFTLRRWDREPRSKSSRRDGQKDLQRAVEFRRCPVQLANVPSFLLGGLLFL